MIPRPRSVLGSKETFFGLNYTIIINKPFVKHYLVFLCTVRTLSSINNTVIGSTTRRAGGQFHSNRSRYNHCFKAVVKYVGGFWPIGVFFAGYRSFFFVPSRQTETKARL